MALRRRQGGSHSVSEKGRADERVPGVVIGGERGSLARLDRSSSLGSRSREKKVGNRCVDRRLVGILRTESSSRGANHRWLAIQALTFRKLRFLARGFVFQFSGSDNHRRLTGTGTQTYLQTNRLLCPWRAWQARLSDRPWPTPDAGRLMVTARNRGEISGPEQIATRGGTEFSF